MTDKTSAAVPELQPTAAPDMRVPGWELVEPARINAEYWQNASRATDDGAEAVLAMEQAHNAYKNCAYALAEKLSRVPSAIPLIEPKVILKDCLVGGDEGVGFHVWLKIGNQEFPIGNAFESKEKEDAEWSADMLRKALARITVSASGRRED